MNNNLEQISEIIIVEGRYDRSAVLNAVDATVFETSGFSVFSDKEKIKLFQRLASKRGLIILTDSDRAGFFIRGRLSGMLDENLNIKHAYIPDVEGREKRKSTFSKDGKLGVEGMDKDVILSALKRAGATFSNTPGSQIKHTDKPSITMNDLYTAGLSGGENSTKKRRQLLQRLDLPSGLSSRKLLDVLNILYSLDEFINLVESDL